MDERSTQRRDNAMIENKITLKGIIDEDFVNYRVPSMTLMFPRCSFKCGLELCQNSQLTKAEEIVIPIQSVFNRYISNPITRAVVCQGLEPFDSWDELDSLLFHFRIHESCFDDFVIYTGYNKDEIEDKIRRIQTMYSNVIIKFGRYVPNQEPHLDPVLGVKLISDNQYAERIEIEGDKK